MRLLALVSSAVLLTLLASTAGRYQTASKPVTHANRKDTMDIPLLFLAPTCISIISNLNKPPSNAGRRSYRQGHFYFTGHENTSYGIVSMHNMERKKSSPDSFCGTGRTNADTRVNIVVLVKRR